MKQRPAFLTGEYFMNGDTACAEGAIAAGCRFFAGYPITPATEVAERMARRLAEVRGIYIQMEDELASMAAVLGASWGGKKSMTATSGPGFSLMMENFGLGLMTETPCVLVNVMRGGPSTGLPTMVGQGDIMQARWGSHGDYEVIAYAPQSPQEMFEHTVKAFNASERYRLPVLVLADEIIGHINEKVVIPAEDEVEIVNRKRPEVPPEKFLPYDAEGEEDQVPPMATAGMGYRVHVTGLTHDERGNPAINAETQKKLIRRLVYKIRDNRDRIIEVEEKEMEDAEIAVFAYGSTARSAARAVFLARREGIKAGLLRPITVWPFPDKEVRETAARVKAIIVPEINMGQLVREVERSSCGAAEVISLPKAGGEIHQPKEILREIRKTKGV